MIQKQYLDKAQLVISCIFVCLLPLDTRVLPPVIGIMVLIGLLHFNKEVFFNNIATYKRYYIFFVLFYLWLLVSLIWSNELGRGLKEAEQKAFYLVAPLLFLLYEKWPTKRLLSMFIISNFIICLFCFINLIPFFINEKMHFINRTIEEGITFHTFRYITYHGGANFISFDVHRLYFSFSLISCLLFFTFCKGVINKKIIRYFMAVIFISVILLLKSKIAIILLGFILLYRAVRVFKSGNFKDKITILVSLILIFSTAFYLTRYRLSQSLDQINAITENKEGSLTERFQYTKCALELIKEAPIFGYGAGDIDTVMNEKLVKYHFTYLYERGVYDPHNEFLKAYVGMGIIGFLFFSGIFASFFYYLSFTKNSLIFFYTGFVFIICLIEPFLSRQAGILPVLFFIGLLTYYGKNSLDD